MVEIDIPVSGNLWLTCLTLDYNGTIAINGALIQGVRERLITLAGKIEIHVLTADTFGSIERNLSDMPCKIYILEPRAQDIGKMNYIKRLGSEKTVAVLYADVAVPDILLALDLLANPLRLIATGCDAMP